MHAIESVDRRLARIERHRAVLARRGRRVGTWRMVVFLATVVLALVAWRAFGEALGWATVIAGLAIFVGLGRVHDRIERARRRWDLWTTLQRRHRARLERDWAGLGPAAHDPLDDEHPFALDLDLVGERSLLHLIDTTVSRGGHRRLRAWLMQTAPDLVDVLARQARVAALVPATHLRDRLALTARIGLGGRRTQWDTERLATVVGTGRDVTFLRTRVLVLTLLATANVGLVLWQAFRGGPPLWIVSFAAYSLLTAASLRRSAETFDDALALEELLEPLRRVLGWLEERPVPAPLEDVVAPLRRSDAHRPAVMLRRVQWVAMGAGLRINQIAWLIANALVPWDMVFALRLEAARRDLAEHLPRWLDALHELEATAALAEFAAVSPGATFPSFVDDDDAPLLETRALGHPLLPPAQCVPNDFTIDRSGRVFLITGSNMSGKSTFLRAIGVNVVLANAGAAVLAQSVRLRAMRVFSCIQVVDSVNDGISYFYAEVRRLGALVRSLDAGSSMPQLSLVDEIYRGTNNRERRAGSEAFVEYVSGRSGALLLATHDLELASMADASDAIRNLHFREEIRDGRMEFDFLLREGACPSSNALRLMAREGLPVPADPDAET